MFARDPSLGWRLTPKWRGHHSHYDFELDYSTNRHGFRGNFGPLPRSDEGAGYAVVGDTASPSEWAAETPTLSSSG